MTTRVRRHSVFWLITIALLAPIAAWAMLQGPDSDSALHAYLHRHAEDPIARLQERLDSGAAKLDFDKKWGYLPSVLRALEIPASSQSLVFSKTSFQIDHISQRSPRALYFNDDVYIGWVQGGTVLEVASIDPVVGSIFYALPQKADAAPKFERLNEGCLICHNSSATAGVPGLVMRSLLVDKDGNPILNAGSAVMTDRTPLNERFGGWYVTGTSGRQLHRGNSFYPGAADNFGTTRTYVARMDLAPTSNLARLPETVDAAKYLSSGSDIAALMVFTHQTEVHNLMARASYEVRSALQDEGTETPVADITQVRIRNAVEPLVAAMFFSFTPVLSEPIRGTSSFAAEFEKRGPFDRDGHSLRQLDLKTRLFRYPLSYLAYSDAFDALPKPAKNYVYRRFREILSSTDTSSAFAHLSTDDRQAILQILQDTKPDFK